MTGREILSQYIGHRLTDGLVQSFYLRNELSDIINVTFLKFEDEWIRTATTDEKTSVQLQDATIEDTEFYGDEEFKYTIRKIRFLFPDFNKFIGRKLLGFKELVLQDDETISFGLNFYFKGDINFIIRNHSYPIDKNEYFFSSEAFDNLIEK